MSTIPRGVIRKGDCFEDTVNKLMDHRAGNVVLVHGLPMGRGGEAVKYGRYPHAWLERDDMVWEPAIKTWVPKDYFYHLGQIGYTVEYTIWQVRGMIHEFETFGPWDEKILARDAEIEETGVYCEDT